MFKHTPVFHRLMVTIELKTPLAIGQGYGETGFDVLLMRDANGLPTIPGSSIAGMLRRSFQQETDVTQTEALFGGDPKYARSGKKQGVISNIQIGFARIHDGNNQCQVNIEESINDDDDVLAFLREKHPLTRERVALNHKGAAKDTGKFDVSAVPAGARFTFELSAWFAQTNPGEWQTLKNLLQKPSLRLGRSKQSGFGAFRVIQLQETCCDMATEVGRQQFARQAAVLAPEPATKTAPEQTKDDDALLAHIHLQIDGLLRMGGNGAVLGVNAGERIPDLLLQAEPVIEWRGNKATLRNKAVVPGSGIKGAMRHRFTFHVNRLNKRFTAEEGLNCPEADELFGHAKDSADNASKNQAGGKAGALLLDDIYIDPNDAHLLVVQHNAIDRYTGGTMDGALYSEQGLWDATLEFPLYCRTPLRGNTLKALQATLEDLTAGRLPLGAGGSRGNGSANPQLSHFTLTQYAEEIEP